MSCHLINVCLCLENCVSLYMMMMMIIIEEHEEKSLHVYRTKYFYFWLAYLIPRHVHCTRYSRVAMFVCVCALLSSSCNIPSAPQYLSIFLSCIQSTHSECLFLYHANTCIDFGYRGSINVYSNTIKSRYSKNIYQHFLVVYVFY